MTDSLTNMQAVKPKGPKVFVAAVLLAAAAGTAWFFLGREPGPVGAPEEPTNILIVGVDDPAAPILEQMGFSVEQLELADAAAAGRSAGSSAEDDIDAALHYADSNGQGYVVFSGAGTLNFGSRAVTSDSATIGKAHRYAVFSVGDFAAEASKVTVDPTPKRYAFPRHAELTRALFEQDKLAATLVGENNLSIGAQPLYERVKAAVELKGAFGLVEQKAKAAHKRLAEYVVESEEAQPRPRVLGKGIERTHGYALANGSVLLLVDAPTLQNPTTPRVSLEWTRDTRAWVQDLEAGERTRCEAADRLRPGELSVHAGGRTLLAQWGARELMVFTVDPEQPGCSLKTVGTVAGDEGMYGRANAAGKVVRSTVLEDGWAAEIHTPDSPHPQTWPLAGCTAVSRPVWIDDTHIATSCEYKPAIQRDDGDLLLDPPVPTIPEQHWIYILSIEDGSVLALPTDDGSRSNPNIWVRSNAPTLTLLTNSLGGVTTHAFKTDVAALFATPAIDRERARPEFVESAASGVRALDIATATSKVLSVEDGWGRFVVSPDGKRVAFGVDNTGRFDRNLAVYEFASHKTRRIAINEWARHDEPTFTPDGQTVVFNSTYSIASDRNATVSQAVDVSGS